MAPPTVVVAMRCGPPSELPQAASAVPGGRRAAPCACRSHRRTALRRRHDDHEEEIRNLFQAEGRTVDNVSVIADRETGRPREFAFVEMSNATEADTAVKTLNGFQMDGRTLTVSEARERSFGCGAGRSGY